MISSCDLRVMSRTTPPANDERGVSTRLRVYAARESVANVATAMPSGCCGSRGEGTRRPDPKMGACATAHSARTGQRQDGDTEDTLGSGYYRPRVSMALVPQTVTERTTEWKPNRPHHDSMRA